MHTGHDNQPLRYQVTELISSTANRKREQINRKRSRLSWTLLHHLEFKIAKIENKTSFYAPAKNV